MQPVNHPQIGKHSIIGIDIRLLVGAEVESAKFKNSRRITGCDFVNFAFSTAWINSQNRGRNSQSLHQQALVRLNAQYKIIWLNFDWQRFGIATLKGIQALFRLLVHAKNILAVWRGYDTKWRTNAFGCNWVCMALQIAKIHPD